MPNVSIIVPVYNAEKYISQCINSILSQTYTDFELILINDGSDDHSGDICDRFSHMDMRIKVYHKKNTGVSSTRNMGIDLSMGEYIGFVDADDELDASTIEMALNNIEANNSDIVIFGYSVYNRFLDKESEEVYDILKLSGYIWNKMYKRKIIGNIRFDENLKLYEDTKFNYLVLCSTNNISYIEKPLYKYYIRDGSATNSFLHNHLSLMKLAMEWRVCTAKHLVSDESESLKYINSIYINYVMSILSNIFWHSRKIKTINLLKEIKIVVDDEQAQYIVNKVGYMKMSRKDAVIIFMVKNKMVIALFCFYKIRNLLKWRSKNA